MMKQRAMLKQQVAGSNPARDAFTTSVFTIIM
jgi:hypothetical protein